MSKTLRLVILRGQDSAAACSVLSALVRLPEAQVVGIVLDLGRVSLVTRIRRLRRHLGREGWSSLAFRIGEAITKGLERLAARVVSSREVSALFATAFHGQALCLDHLGDQHGIPVFSVDNINSPRAVAILRSLAPDLGVALGTRILKRSTSSVPRMGCLNLHLGKIPEYRSMSPGFWELYDGQLTAGVTVHLIDDGRDTGDIVGEEIVPIHDSDTLETLRRRLEARGRELLARCVTGLAQGRVTPRPQPSGRWPVRASPTRRERKELERQLPATRKRQVSWIYATKTAWYLLLYYTGVPHVVRAARRIAGMRRACVLVYHRVNDLGDDPLTTSVHRFAEHMLILRKYYSVVGSSVLIDRGEAGHPFPSNSVAIHFDDCYRDVFTNAKPVLAALDFPASLFVSSGYVGSTRRFPHDDSSPWVFENLRPEDLRELAGAGFEVGSHTVNHVDLGQASDETTATELAQSKHDLEAIVHRPVALFSFPFGKRTNARPGVEELVRQAGYRAMFSAYGGYVTSMSNLFDLPRVGVGGETRPLDLLMEIEGLSLGALWRWWTSRRARRPWKEPPHERPTVYAPISGADESDVFERKR